MAAELPLRLQIHLPIAALQREVIHIERAESTAHSGEDLVDRHAHGLGLVPVDLCLVAGNADIQCSADVGQLRALTGRTHQPVGLRLELERIALATQLQITFNTAGQRQPIDRWRYKGHDIGFLDIGAQANDAVGHSLRALTFTSAIIPINQRDERHAHIGPQAAIHDIEAGKTGNALDLVHVDDVLAQLLAHRFSTLQRRYRGQLIDRQQKALILLGNEAAGHAIKQEQGRTNQYQEEQQGNLGVVEHPADQIGKTIRQAIKAVIEPGKLGRGFGFLAIKQKRAHDRAQGQRNHAGNTHRHGNGDRELAIQLATEPAQEGHWGKHRNQHQGRADNSTGHLFHGLAGCFVAR